MKPKAPKKNITPKNESELTAQLNDIRFSSPYMTSSEKDSLKVVVFNAQRGRYLDEIEAYFTYHPILQDADIILFNELDIGMVRSGNLDTVKELSQRLQMNYFFGAEFVELTKGEKEERAVPGENRDALHGNAILSRFCLHDPYLLRLPLLYDWYDDYQQRLGSRNALFATIKNDAWEVGLVCTHLENNTSPRGRAEQMESILKKTAERFGASPVVIGGDMNTHTFDDTQHIPATQRSAILTNNPDRFNQQEKYEPLFSMVNAWGFDYNEANLPRKITCRGYHEEAHPLMLNIDWIFTKGVQSFAPVVVTTIFNKDELPGLLNMDESQGIEISDHNAIVVEIQHTELF